MEPVIPNARQAAFAVAALVLALSADVSAQGEKAEATTLATNVSGVDGQGDTLARSASAQTRGSIDWNALKPASGYQFEDPFSVLTRDQLRELSALARMLQQGSKPDDGTESGRAAAALYSKLAKQDVDADELLSRRQEISEKRRRAAMQINPAVVGHDIEIVGFPIPAALANGDTSSFFLVPSPGMCSHVTLPPPNQVILVTMDASQEQLDFRAPVRVKGVISDGAGQHEVFLVDGRAVVEHAYLITKADVSMLPSFSTPLAARIRSAWPVESNPENSEHKQ